jgi:L-threonylcarbamoyladenylate synthase
MRLAPSSARRADAASYAREAASRGQIVGSLVLGSFTGAVDHRIQMPADPEAYARRLYAALHELDQRGCSLVLVERVPPTPAWEAVRDRLGRAAH